MGGLAAISLFACGGEGVDRERGDDAAEDDVAEDDVAEDDAAEDDAAEDDDSAKDDAAKDDADDAADDDGDDAQDPPEISADGPFLYGGGTTIVPSADRIVYCEEAVGEGDDALIDDWEDEDLDSPEQDGRRGSWYFYNDETADATQDLEVDGSGADGSDFALHTSGEGHTRWGAGVGFTLNEGVEDEDGKVRQCSYDASYYDGIQFYAKGNDVNVRVKLIVPEVIPVSEGGRCEASCFDDHGLDFTFTDEWKLYQVPFSAVQQAGWGFDAGPFDPSVIRMIQFQTDRGAEFDYWLDELEFYRD